jgi:hypothetical protein
MLVSSEFCEKHLQLIFTMLEKATEPIIRANLIIALGDLSFRCSDQSVLTYLKGLGQEVDFNYFHRMNCSRSSDSL